MLQSQHFFLYNRTEKKRSHLTNITPNKFCVYHYVYNIFFFSLTSYTRNHPIQGIFRAKASRFMVLNTNLYKVLNAEILSLVLTHADLLK